MHMMTSSPSSARFHRTSKRSWTIGLMVLVAAALRSPSPVSAVPTAAPSSAPSTSPVSAPSSAPSKAPSSGPSAIPSSTPSSSSPVEAELNSQSSPVSAPSAAPSSSPSAIPSSTPSSSSPVEADLNTQSSPVSAPSAAPSTASPSPSGMPSSFSPDMAMADTSEGGNSTPSVPSAPIPFFPAANISSPTMAPFVPQECEMNEVCEALDLTGMCCPSKDNVTLACCHGSGPVEGQCINNPQCKADGLKDDCCPTVEGVYLTCCMTVPSTCGGNSSNCTVMTTAEYIATFKSAAAAGSTTRMAMAVSAVTMLLSITWSMM